MPSFLSGIAAKLAGALALVALIAFLYARYEQVIAERDVAVAQHGADQSTLATLQAANQQNLAELARIKADEARATAAQAAEAKASVKRARDLQTIQRMIAHAPAQDRGAVPPVILHAIDGLLRPASVPAGAGDENRRSPAAGAGNAP